MRSLPIVVLVAAMLLGASGCGERETRRTVNPQAEALRFFPQGTLVVAFVDAGAPAADLERLRAAARGGPWDGALSDALDVLDRAGIGRAELLEALDGPVAVGARTLGDLREGRLVAAASGEPDRVDELVGEAIRRRAMSEVASYRGARLLRAGTGAVAVRDGVVVVATGFEAVRGALEVRDADRDDVRLDDGAVRSLLDELPENEPFVAAVRARPLIVSGGTGLDLHLLPQLEAARTIALGIVPDGDGRLRVAVVVRLDGNGGDYRELLPATGDRLARLHADPSVPGVGHRDARLAAEGLLATLGRLDPAHLATARDLATRLGRAGIEPEELASTVEERNVSIALEPAGGATARVEVEDADLARRALEALLGEERDGVHGPGSLHGRRIGGAIRGRTVGIAIDGGDPRSAAAAGTRRLPGELGALALDLPLEPLLDATQIARPPAPLDRVERVSGSVSRDGDRVRGRLVVELAG